MEKPICNHLHKIRDFENGSILKPKNLLCHTKDLAKIVIVMILGFLLILAGILIKYKPVYEVTIAGKKLGYIENIKEFKNLIEQELENQKKEDIVDVSFIDEPSYEYKLITRTSDLNENKMIETIKATDIVKTYKYYEVCLNDEIQEHVTTLEEAEKIVTKIKEEYEGEDLELNLQINEKYSQSEVTLDSLEIAENAVENKVKSMKEEKEKSEALAVVNDVKISVLPVSGRITSRYGESSSLRRSTHTGLDIACTTGTNIKVVSSGTVIFAAYQGSYGNLVKVNHGNGIETWYGHCSKIYAKVGDEVDPGDIIAAVGSTGNSTGPHLHFEIRMNGNTVNPQNYIYRN